MKKNQIYLISISGSDDCTFKIWDLRTDPHEKVHVSKRLRLFDFLWFFFQYEISSFQLKDMKWEFVVFNQVHIKNIFLQLEG